jgi:hypothetical protein
MKQVLGTQLSKSARREALNRFLYRFTGDHKPQWVSAGMPDGSPYPLQFKDDNDWLANTRFWVTSEGDLSENYDSCESTPTWPNNPELRQSP